MHLLLDALHDGEIPSYSFLEAQGYSIWSNETWVSRFPSKRCIIPVEDMSFPLIQKALESAPKTEGTLIFSMRGAYTGQTMVGSKIFDVIAGLAVTSNIFQGQLVSDPPWPIVRQFILALQGMPATNPIVEEALQRRAAKVSAPSDNSASKKAKEILLHNLDPIQQQDFLNHGYFVVKGLDGHTYRIHSKHSHNVFRIENGKPTFEYCLTTEGFLPLGDVLLTQKLLIEADTAQFLAIANAWDLRHGRSFLQGGQLSFTDRTGHPLCGNL